VTDATLYIVHLVRMPIINHFAHSTEQVA